MIMLRIGQVKMRQKQKIKIKLEKNNIDPQKKQCI